MMMLYIVRMATTSARPDQYVPGSSEVEAKRIMRGATTKSVESGDPSTSKTTQHTSSSIVPQALSPAQTKTWLLLKQGVKDVSQRALTYLINRLGKNKDEAHLGEILPTIADVERYQGKSPAKYFKRFSDPTVSKVVIDTRPQWFTGESHRLGDPSKTDIQPPKSASADDADVQPRRDIGELIAFKKQQQQPLHGADTSRIIESVIGAARNSNNAYGIYQQMPGQDMLTKGLYYTLPELQVIDAASNNVGLGWTQDDSDYLRQILSPTHNPNDDSFKQRLTWIGKLIANPSRWSEAITGMTKEAITRSEAYKWLEKTLSGVANTFDNTKARSLRNQLQQTGKLEGSTKIPTGDIATGTKGAAGIEDPSSKIGSIRPVMTTIKPETDEERARWHDLLRGTFERSEATDKVLTQLYDDQYFKERYGQIYSDAHDGRRWDGASSVFTDLPQGGMDDVVYQLHMATRDSFDNSGTPLPTGFDDTSIRANYDRARLRTRLDADTARRQQTRTAVEEEDPEPPKEGDPAQEGDEVQPSQETTDGSVYKRIPELRPKFGMMSQKELEDTLIGDDKERKQTNYTWAVYDLKPVDETGEARQRMQSGDDNPLFDHNIDHYNMRYGSCFLMPPITKKVTRPVLVPRTMENIYSTQMSMIDAYNNKQFSGINPESYRPPMWEERARILPSEYMPMIPVQPYRNGVDYYNYRMPQYKEPVKSLRNRGRYF